MHSYESADTRRRVASRHIFHGRADGRPCSMYISIPPLRGMCGMILYAKSSLELIVNNRIGKVGIRPDGRPPPSRPSPPPAGTTPWFTSPPFPPFLLRSTLLTVSLPPQRISFSTGVSALQICCPSVCLSVRSSVRAARLSVSTYVRTYVYVRTYTYVRARAPFPCGI